MIHHGKASFFGKRPKKAALRFMILDLRSFSHSQTARAVTILVTIPTTKFSITDGDIDPETNRVVVECSTII
jgi:hypothetical protein